MSDADTPINFQFAQMKQRFDEGHPVTTGENPGLHMINEQKGCEHLGRAVVDVEARTVKCDKCGRIIDPFDYLVVICRAERRMQVEYNTIQQEKKMQRGFYEARETLKKKGCRHTQTYPTHESGQRKCLRCDKIIEAPEQLIPFSPRPVQPAVKGKA